jgi:hypothetical protein
LLALFLVTLAWKLSCLWRLVHSPVFATHLLADAAAYWTWAQGLSQHGFLGHEPFFLGPLYPYALAFFGLADGTSIVPALVVQCVLGAATTVMIAEAARTLCRPPFALAAGLLAGAYAMATFMDTSLLMESLLWALGAGLLLLNLSPADAGPSNVVASQSGALIGAMTLGRGNFAGLLAVLWLKWRRQHGARRANVLTAVAAGVVALCCGPVLVRHLYLGHGWIPTTYSLGFNAYEGNGADANGTYMPFVNDRLPTTSSLPPREGGIDGDGRDYLERFHHVRLDAEASSRYWLSLMWRSIREQPWVSFRRLFFKLALSLNHVESTQISSIYAEQMTIGPLGLPLVGEFGVVALLGFVGLLAIRRSDARILLVGTALVAIATMVVFFVVDRYRHHLALVLLVASGPGLQAIADAIRTPDRWRRALGWEGLAFAVFAVVVWWPLVPLWRVEASVQAGVGLGEAALLASRPDEAIRNLEACVAAASNVDTKQLQASSAARRNLDQVCVLLAELHARNGDLDRSQAALMRAVEIQPSDTTAAVDLAALVAIRGSRSGAERYLAERGLGTDALESSLLRWARRFESTQRWPAMEAALRSTIAIDSTSEEANVVLLRLLASQGRRDEAGALLATFERRGVRPAVVEREAAALRAAER